MYESIFLCWKFSFSKRDSKEPGQYFFRCLFILVKVKVEFYQDDDRVEDHAFKRTGVVCD